MMACLMSPKTGNSSLASSGGPCGGRNPKVMRRPDVFFTVLYKQAVSSPMSGNLLVWFAAPGGAGHSPLFWATGSFWLAPARGLLRLELGVHRLGLGHLEREHR